MSYDTALAYLDSLVNFESIPEPRALNKINLDRMVHLCRLLGEPQRSFRSVLIAGTNGKGSVAAMLYSMLKQTQLCVGLYTSPHLADVRERIRAHGPQVGGDGEALHPAVPYDAIPQEAFSECMQQVKQALETMRQQRKQEVPTYFEALTALAFCYYQRCGVEVAVLEVGLGGRLDATNVVSQDVSVISPISLDHTHILGDTLEKIAREKAGIIKPKQKVILAQQHPTAEVVVQTTCEAYQVPIYYGGRDFDHTLVEMSAEGMRVDIRGLRGDYKQVRLPLLGAHQAQNAAVAVAAFEALSQQGVPHAAVVSGIEKAEWPGRLEIVNEAPCVLIDGAHNDHSFEVLANALRDVLPEKNIHLLVGASADKDISGLGRYIAPLVSSITCTRSQHPRAMDPDKLAQALAIHGHDMHVMADVADAYTYLLNTVSPEDVIVVTGSLFLVGELRAAIKQAGLRVRKHADA